MISEVQSYPNLHKVTKFDDVGLLIYRMKGEALFSLANDIEDWVEDINRCIEEEFDDTCYPIAQETA